jgi:heme-degrading monooxygenase HmoA
MFTATFTFAKGEYDDEFHRLDQAIAKVARSIPGYLGEEAWESPASGLVSTVYYWQSLEALQALIEHPRHIEAKRKQAKWIRGYHIVIGQAIKSYGEGGIPHPLAPMFPQAGPITDHGSTNPDSIRRT